MNPIGYVITSADTSLPPIIAFSLNTKFLPTAPRTHPVLSITLADAQSRLNALKHVDTHTRELIEESAKLRWQLYLSGRLLILAEETQQWPTARDGWLTTDWFQTGHFNDKCPTSEDSSNGRSPVGCVATALAQLLQYWEYPKTIHFNSKPRLLGGDAYTSKGDAGDISIDGDATKYGFPSFDELNTRLSNIKYNGDPSEEACLSFAAGVKVQMYYGIDQSGASTTATARAFKRHFLYGSAEKVRKETGVWDESRDIVIQNIKDGWPVQAGIAGETGRHSVIIDGFRSDGFFHLNLGWEGRRADIWYALPLIEGSWYTFDTIHTLVYDIAPFTGWDQYGADERNTFRCQYAAPLDAKNRWQVSSSDRFFFTGLVVGQANRIYASSSPRFGSGSDHASLWLINEQGVVEGQIEFPEENEAITFPAQNSIGELFIGTDLGRIYRVDPDLRNSQRIFTEPGAKQIPRPIKIDAKDNIYFGTLSKFYSITRTGDIRWRFEPSGDIIITNSVPTINSAVQRVYVQYYDRKQHTGHFAAIDDTTGQVQVEHTCNDISFASRSYGIPSVANDGSIFVGCKTTLYKLDPLTLKAVKSRDFSPSYVVSNTPIQGYNDAVYLPHWTIEGDKSYLTLSALNPSDLSTRWQVQHPSSEDSDNILQGYCTRNNIVVFTYSKENGESPDTYEVYAYRDNLGSADLVWQKHYGTSGGILAFGPGATLYVIGATGLGNTIFAVSEGEEGDPDGAGMAFTNNLPPNFPENVEPPDWASNLKTPVTLSWACSDPDGNQLKYDVLLCEFSGTDTDSLIVARGLTSSSFALKNLRSGRRYSWRIVASDGQAEMEGTPSVFTTKNSKPQIDITSPVPNKQFRAPASITIVAEANDTDGEIQNIEFFSNSIKIGEDKDSKAPYEITWPNVGRGQYDLTARAIDDAGSTTNSTPIPITVLGACEPPVIPFQELPRATIMEPYDVCVMVENGTGSPPFTWSIAAGQLPPELVLDRLSGCIVGTPLLESSGNYSFQIQVCDSCADGTLCAISPILGITVQSRGTSCIRPEIPLQELPDGIVGELYNACISVEKGTVPFTWTIVEGQLPAGMILDSASGCIIGTPVNGSQGEYRFRVDVCDSCHEGSVCVTSPTFAIGIAPSPCPALVISTACPLPSGPELVLYQRDSDVVGFFDGFTVDGGINPFSWSIEPGNGGLPPGLMLDTNTGKILGAPEFESRGTYPFTICVQDSCPSQRDPVCKECTLTIDPGVEDGHLELTKDGKMTRKRGKPWKLTLSGKLLVNFNSYNMRCVASGASSELRAILRWDGNEKVYFMPGERTVKYSPGVKSGKNANVVKLKDVEAKLTLNFKKRTFAFSAKNIEGFDPLVHNSIMFIVPIDNTQVNLEAQWFERNEKKLLFGHSVPPPVPQGIELEANQCDR